MCKDDLTRVARAEIDALLTRLREVETMWEGAEAVIASQAKEMVEIVDKLAQAEQLHAEANRCRTELAIKLEQAEQRLKAEIDKIHASKLMKALAQAEQRATDFQQQIDFLHDQMQAREQRVVGLEAALKRDSIHAAIENAVQLILVNPPGKSFQDDADDWAASSMDIGAFVETITNHVMALLTPPPPAPNKQT